MAFPVGIPALPSHVHGFCAWKSTASSWNHREGAKLTLRNSARFFFSEKMVRPWNRLPRKALEPPYLEVFKNRWK